MGWYGTEADREIAELNRNNRSLRDDVADLENKLREKGWEVDSLETSNSELSRRLQNLQQELRNLQSEYHNVVDENENLKKQLGNPDYPLEDDEEDDPYPTLPHEPYDPYRYE